MESNNHLSYKIEDRSYLSIIKKEIYKKAIDLGFSEERAGKLDIIISELSSNLLKFGEKKRELLWKPVVLAGNPGIEIISIDKGQGIYNTNQALQDGFSTAGTQGEGLGAILRLSDHFDIYSQQGAGTIVLSRVFKNAPATERLKSDYIAIIAKPKDGEKLCGDSHYIERFPNQDLAFLIVDGLGHGEEAHIASSHAVELYKKTAKKTPALALQHLHEGLKKTRGGVGMALYYHAAEKRLSYCGIGNISGKVSGFNTNKSLVSFNGILGMTASRMHDNDITIEAPKLLIIHSDGINTRWDLNIYPQVSKHDPAILAACLYRDFNRNNDDLTIIVCKLPS
jgi:anti-sigma regulatory factor (Ser/Thr protein kinase)